MIRIYLMEQGKVKKEGFYKDVAEAAGSDEVNNFIDFIKDCNDDPSNPSPVDVQEIYTCLADCKTTRDLQAVFAKYFDHDWCQLCLCEVAAADLKAVLQNLQTRSSMEIDERGAVYYLHITDEGDIVDDVSKADISFWSILDKDAYKNFDSDYDWRDDVEVEDNKYFLAVAKDLTKQVINYFTIK